MVTEFSTQWIYKANEMKEGWKERREAKERRERGKEGGRILYKDWLSWMKLCKPNECHFFPKASIPKYSTEKFTWFQT